MPLFQKIMDYFLIMNYSVDTNIGGIPFDKAFLLQVSFFLITLNLIIFKGTFYIKLIQILFP